MVKEFIRLGFFGRQIGFVFRSHFKAVNLSGHFYEVMIVMYPIKIPSVRYVIVHAVCNTDNIVQLVLTVTILQLTKTVFACECVACFLVCPTYKPLHLLCSRKGSEKKNVYTSIYSIHDAH